MSKRSYKTCNTKEQEIRWRIKVRLKKLKRSWCAFKDTGGKERDHTYHWAKMLRSLDVLDKTLPLLNDKKRVAHVSKIVNRLKKKMEPYREPFSNITKEYGNKKRYTNSEKYKQTTRKVLKKL